jgi:hypothetical protein
VAQVGGRNRAQNLFPLQEAEKHSTTPWDAQTVLYATLSLLLRSRTSVYNNYSTYSRNGTTTLMVEGWVLIVVKTYLQDYGRVR